MPEESRGHKEEVKESSAGGCNLLNHRRIALLS